jgi:cytochrome c biogenesis protein CcmG/thiol:disulfide interchange protein DsbE
MTGTIYTILVSALWLFILYDSYQLVRSRIRSGSVLPSSRTEWGSFLNDLLTLALAFGLLFLMESRFHKPLDTVLSQQGKAFPPLGFTLEPSGQSSELAAFRGKLVILNLWATWCGPCRIEMPELDEVQEEFGPQGLEIIAVTDEDPQVVKQYLDRHPFRFDVGVITRSNPMIGSLDTRPVSILIGPDGRILDMVAGARGYSFFSGWARDHLGKK